MLIADFIMKKRERQAHYDIDGYIAPGFPPRLILNAVANNYKIRGPRYHVTIHSTIKPGIFDFNVRETTKETIHGN